LAGLVPVFGKTKSNPYSVISVISEIDKIKVLTGLAPVFVKAKK
jgi:hypothetical protein